jgi:hypothetical protein
MAIVISTASAVATGMQAWYANKQISEAVRQFDRAGPVLSTENNRIIFRDGGETSERKLPARIPRTELESHQEVEVSISIYNDGREATRIYNVFFNSQAPGLDVKILANEQSSCRTVYSANPSAPPTTSADGKNGGTGEHCLGRSWRIEPGEALEIKAPIKESLALLKADGVFGEAVTIVVTGSGFRDIRQNLDSGLIVAD